MAKSDSTKNFGERLSEAFRFKGVTDHKQRVERVSQAFGVTFKTAEKYLQSASCPYFINRRPSLLWNLAEDLEASGEWIFNGEGYSPATVYVAKKMESMTKWEQSKYLRFLIRLLNNDAKARRLGDMLEARQISPHQFLSAM